MRRKNEEPQRTRHLKMALRDRKDMTLIDKVCTMSKKSQDINPLAPELEYILYSVLINFKQFC